ncbi:MAG TPA: FxsA family protein [Spirochaetia bacterium]|nr:FxsA family protein [Spirochaetia bacterium]
MREIRLLLTSLDRDFFFKLVLALAIFCLVPAAEIVFFIYLGNLIGNWLVFILAVLIGLPGVFVAQSQLHDIREALRERIRSRQYPGSELADLLGILASGLLLVTPGFLTDVLGYLLLVPSVRAVVARSLASKMNKGLKDLYDYFRLRELQRD